MKRISTATEGNSNPLQGRIDALPAAQQKGFAMMSQGSIIPYVLERIMKDFKTPEGESYLTQEVFDLIQTYNRIRLNTKSLLEEILLDQMLVTHCRWIVLQSLVDLYDPINHQERFLDLASRELNNLRRIISTYQQVSGQKHFTVINATHANVAQNQVNQQQFID